MSKETARLVRATRKHLKLTQEELGKKIGKDRTTVAHYERGTITVPGDIVLALQKLLPGRSR